MPAQEIYSIIEEKLPCCCECNRKRDDEGKATFILEGEGNAIHAKCADKIKLIKLTCHHTFDRTELTK